jgi:hypothetical protein
MLPHHEDHLRNPLSESSVLLITKQSVTRILQAKQRQRLRALPLVGDGRTARRPALDTQTPRMTRNLRVDDPDDSDNSDSRPVGAGSVGPLPSLRRLGAIVQHFVLGLGRARPASESQPARAIRVSSSSARHPSKQQQQRTPSTRPTRPLHRHAPAAVPEQISVAAPPHCAPAAVALPRTLVRHRAASEADSASR